ncbi:DUF4158 domain-containing protein [Nonomuraea sp. MTCD27]|uniref:DUF4158 domain-containing protein n=1 Tax=Nonomuraea sp. MTCD27 TaxID=1676747 RepID=UPI0035C2237D
MVGERLPERPVFAGVRFFEERVGGVRCQRRCCPRSSWKRLRSFPEISADELIRCFTPTSADVVFVDPGRGRRSVDQLGMLVQLCSRPWPRSRIGWVCRPRRRRYTAIRTQARSNHLAQAKYLEWTTAPAGRR